MSRIDELVNALQIMCMMEPPNFDRLNQRATAMQMRVLTDFATPPVNGVVVRSKTWLMGMKGGPLAFSVSDGKGTPREATMCGISAPEATVEEMQAALSAALHLNEPRVVPGRNGGLATIIWDSGLGAGTKLVLVAGQFKPQPGFALIYEVEQTR